MKTIIRLISFACFAIIVTIISCNKAKENAQFEDWKVHDYCVPKFSGVQCYQNDYSTITLCCEETGRYHDGQTVVLSEDNNITYYRQYIQLIKSY